MTTTEKPDDEPQFSFLEALLGGLNAEPKPEPEPVDTAEEVAKFGDMIQGLAAVALGVRAQAIEAGVDPAAADSMAMSTYAVSLTTAFGGANG